MNELQKVFSFQERKVRLVKVDGEPWFVAKDVCGVLGLSVKNAARHIGKLAPEAKRLNQINTPGGLQDVWCVNESGLYQLTMRSDKPEAHLFQTWIASEVLPSIHKTGMYLTPDVAKMSHQDRQSVLEQALAIAQESLEKKQQQIEIQAKQLEASKPAVSFIERYVKADESMTPRSVAKVLRIPERTFFSLLQSAGILYKQGGRWLPSSVHQQARHFEVKTTEKNDIVFTQTYFTPKGVLWITKYADRKGWRMSHEGN
jgi:prophage antirepressor-like protein